MDVEIFHNSLNALYTFIPIDLQVNITTKTHSIIITCAIIFSLRKIDITELTFSIHSFSNQGKAKVVRPLILETDFEKEVFERGRQRYEERRKRRSKDS